MCDIHWPIPFSQVVGNTTSGAYGYTVKQSIAFAYLPAELCTPGTQVHVDLLGQHCPAVVHKDAPLKIEPVRTRLAESAQKSQGVSL